MIRPLIPVTLELAALATLFSIVLGVPTGVISAVRQDTTLDYVLRVFSLAGLSMPAFWLGMVIILALVRWCGLDPAPHIRLAAGELQDPHRAVSPARRWPWGIARRPCIMRITRSAVLEVIREDYIRTARAKGQGERVVIWGHAFKNAVLPVVTVIGIEFAFLIGGLVVTETVFNLPGVARFLVQAILWRDYPIVQNLVMFIAIVVILSNLTVDLLYGWLDPRVQVWRLSRLSADSGLELVGAPRVFGQVGWGTTIRRFVTRKPLGAAGGALMLLLLVCALFAEPLATHDPIATDAAPHAGPARGPALPGQRSPGPRHLQPHHLRGPHLAGGRGHVDLAGLGAGRNHRAPLRVLRRQDRPDLATCPRHPAGAPLLVLALVMSAALGPAVHNVIIAISVPIIPRAARVIRASVLSIREMQYVEAARALGLRHLRIAFGHILPNTIGPFIVLTTAQLGSAVLVEATLSFLGLGVPSPIRPGGACCRSPPPSTPRRRRGS